jgi:hypothetical protein
MLGETVSVICVMALYGPPVVLLAAPWLFLVLMLSGPFALVATLVLALLAAAALVGGIAAILATPYLLLRRYRTVAPTVARVPVTLRRAVA